MTQLQEHLEKINACQEACEWAGKRTPQEAWDQCKRADWLLWWAWTVRRDSRPPLIRATCCGPRRALRFVPAGELRPLRAIEAAEAVAENDTPELRAAAGVAARGDWAARGARAARGIVRYWNSPLSWRAAHASPTFGPFAERAALLRHASTSVGFALM